MKKRIPLIILIFVIFIAVLVAFIGSLSTPLSDSVNTFITGTVSKLPSVKVTKTSTKAFTPVANGFLLTTTKNSNTGINKLSAAESSVKLGSSENFISSIRLQYNLLDDELSKLVSRNQFPEIFYIAYEKMLVAENLYEGSSNANWPNKNESLVLWEKYFLEELTYLTSVLDKHQYPKNKVVIELWNEPNMKIFWNTNFNNYLKIYKKAYEIIKKDYPEFKIAGPSVAIDGNVNGSAQILNDRFIKFLWINKLSVDYIAYHELSSTRDTNEMFSYFSTLRKKLDFFKFKDTKINITEYLSPLHFINPGMISAYITKMQYAPVDSALRACWIATANNNQETCFTNSLNGLLRTDGSTRNIYYLYDYYSKLSGELLSVTSNYVETMAVMDNSNSKLSILIGNYEDSFNNLNLDITEIASNLTDQKITLEINRYLNAESESKPTTLVNGKDFTVKGGVITINNINSWAAYTVTVSGFNTAGSISKL